MPRKTKRHDDVASGGKKPPTGQYAPALNAGLRATTTRVQEMHHAIAAKTFDALQKVPGVSVPARVVQGAHDAITDGVYAAVRHAGSAVLSVAGVAEALSVDPKRQRSEGRR